LPPSQLWDHKIKLEDRIDHLLKPKLYIFSLAEQVELKKFIDKNLKKGFIQKSKSHMVLPFFFPVIDYYKLNKIVVKKKYPLPIIQELL
ncbi:hypothetical protein HETIRDRAFT_16941, partial [Heterobasidion irregulare TC 32-1]